MAEATLITGCSSGIGRALAEEFHRRGHLVYATARRVERLADLQEQGIRTAGLDVNAASSIDASGPQPPTSSAGFGGVDIQVESSPRSHRRCA